MISINLNLNWFFIFLSYIFQSLHTKYGTVSSVTSFEANCLQEMALYFKPVLGQVIFLENKAFFKRICYY